MATNNFLVFDEQAGNIQTDLEYQSATQRISGVIPGLAEPELHNKLYRQVSIMAAAIGKVLAEANYNASDADLNTLAANIKALFVSKPLDAYPVGSIYMSVSSTSPATLFGGTWERIQGRFLLGASSTYGAGTTGGEATHALSAAEMPTHNHGASTAGAGAHSHSGTAASAGNHDHGRGTINIKGTFSGVGQKYGGEPSTLTGAFYVVNTTDAPAQGVTISNSGAKDDYFGFEASRSWEGRSETTGAHTHNVSTNQAVNHTHSVTINNAGSGGAHNNMPPYLSVYMWQRTA